MKLIRVMVGKTIRGTEVAQAAVVRMLVWEHMNTLYCSKQGRLDIFVTEVNEIEYLAINRAMSQVQKVR